MKTICKYALSRFAAIFLLSLTSFATWAQDTTITSRTTRSETTTTTSEWYTQPWVWIAGGAVFILLLIALLRGNSKDTEVSRSTTVIKDR